jgi:hypothetical protein
MLVGHIQNMEQGISVHLCLVTDFSSSWTIFSITMKCGNWIVTLGPLGGLSFFREEKGKVLNSSTQILACWRLFNLFHSQLGSGEQYLAISTWWL